MINPKEAEVVKRIYREYLEGKSYYAIGKGLSADGIRTAAGSDFWLASTLKKILMNERYIGDALLQKTITTDFLTKKRFVNRGIAPQYYVENSHGGTLEGKAGSKKSIPPCSRRSNHNRIKPDRTTRLQPKSLVVLFRIQAWTYGSS